MTTQTQDVLPPPSPPPSGGGGSVGGEAAAAPQSYEEQHVHSVYERIAPHFSATRHKPWPRVAAYLRAQPPGAVGLDVGCGNGKYLGVNPDVAVLGSDRSGALVGLARERDWEVSSRRDNDGRGAAASEAVAVADGLALPFRIGGAKVEGQGQGGSGVDFVICIAVLHHLSTRERRVEGVRALLECLRGDGTVLVFVWALEQRSSRRGWDEGADQDQLVSWVMKAKQVKQPKAAKKGVVRGGSGGDPEPAAAMGREDGGGDKTYQRYYHLYKKGELEEDVVSAGGVVVDSGYDQDNWWAIASRKT